MICTLNTKSAMLSREAEDDALKKMRKDANIAIQNIKSEDDSVDEDVVDEEQLEEYSEMLEDLGPYADKVKINSLSMIAEDNSDCSASASAYYNCIRDLIITIPANRMLPLVYVVDSILKNVGGAFIRIIEMDVKHWFPVVHSALGIRQPELLAKLKKVFTTWKEASFFKPDTLQEISACFQDAEVERAKTAVAKSKEQNDVNMDKIPTELRKQMQVILDDLHSDENELDKVSLERLAMINPKLFTQVKLAATDVMKDRAADPSSGKEEYSPFVETRDEAVVERTMEWQKVDLSLHQARDLITNLQSHVRKGSMDFSSLDSLQISAAAAMANHMTVLLQKLKQQDENNHQNSYVRNGSNSLKSVVNDSTQKSHNHSVDMSKFTTEDIMKQELDLWIVGKLYDQGLPFISSVDGRRFATEGDLSNHLDKLFKKGQVEKTMQKPEERGWYISESKWTNRPTANNPNNLTLTTSGDPQDQVDPQSLSVQADESRSKCIICGIPFEMFFDQEEGEFMYSNCHEMNVLNDDAAEKESDVLLVHETCYRGLGSPAFLTMDQVLRG